ncbi:MAG: hypothetical protein L0Y42_00810 [Phycisphaerales bacterium]|nr:hypothetical protein [Phycisphaerales bacterium]
MAPTPVVGFPPVIAPPIAEALAMQLTMTDEEAHTLKNLLESYLPELRMEAARTDLPARELRRELRSRSELAERLIEQLESSPTES